MTILSKNSKAERNSSVLLKGESSLLLSKSNQGERTSYSRLKYFSSILLVVQKFPKLF